MAKKKIITLIVIAVLLAIYLPGFSRFKQLKERNKSLEAKIAELKQQNEELEDEIHKLETDPTYLEGVAREKLKKTRKGEIVYRVD